MHMKLIAAVLIQGSLYYMTYLLQVQRDDSWMLINAPEAHHLHSLE